MLRDESDGEREDEIRERWRERGTEREKARESDGERRKMEGEEERVSVEAMARESVGERW